MKKLCELFEAIHTPLALSTSDEVKSACDLIVKTQDMSGGEYDTIVAAYENGPLWDGDVPSKASRDSLLKDGFIAKVIVNGESGYNACTYKGAEVYRLIRAGARDK